MQILATRATANTLRGEDCGAAMDGGSIQQALESK
jgi:hypothetical protein